MLFRLILFVWLCESFLMANYYSSNELNEKLENDLADKYENTIGDKETYQDYLYNTDGEKDTDYLLEKYQDTIQSTKSIINGIKKAYTNCLIRNCSFEEKLNVLKLIKLADKSMSSSRAPHKRNLPRAPVEKKKEKNFRDFISMRY